MKALLHAAGPLLTDSLGVIAFAVLTACGVGLLPAVTLSSLTAVGVIAWHVARRESVAPLQWLSLGLVLLSAVAALVNDDPRWVMAKPTVVYVLVGLAMLKRGWMCRYVPPLHRELVADWMIRFGYVWAVMMFGLAAANLAVAVHAPERWIAFIAVVPVVAKVGLFVLHFGSVRLIGHRRARAAGLPAL